MDFQSVLQEGAVLLTVRVNRGGRKKKIAVDLVKQYGGVCALQEAMIDA